METSVSDQPTYNNKEIIEIIEQRMKIGLERYGHGLNIDHDTRKWGTSEDSWEEMALEEIMDGMVYTAAALLRLKKRRLEESNKKV